MKTGWRAAHVTLLALTMGLVALSCSSAEPSGFVPESGRSGDGQPAAESMQAALDRLVDSGVPGGVVLVKSADAETVVSSGVANRETGTAIDADTPVPLGGVTTAYVATVLLEMADEGLIDLGNSVEDHLPGLLSYGWDVAVFDLLQHIAGVPDYYAMGTEPGVVISGCAANGTCNLTAPEAISLIDQADSDFQPGEGWGWSNSNYRVAEMVIESLTGNSWSDEVEARILEPVGLDATVANPDWGAATDLARGYADLDGDGATEDVTGLLPYSSGANGAMTATLTDLVDFVGPLLEGELLSTSAAVALFAAAPTGFGSEEYGHGVFFPAGEEQALSAAAGEALGYSIYVEHDRDTGITTAIVLNQSGGIDPLLWGDLVVAATAREACVAEERGTTVPGGLRLFCSSDPAEPGQSIQ
jgi:D-alanyl-D-alanine carboxypeptidase